MICRYKCTAIYSGAGTEYRSRLKSGVSRKKKTLLLSTFVRRPDLMIWTVWQNLNLVSCFLADFLCFLKEVTFLHVGRIVLSSSTFSLTQKSSWALVLQCQVHRSVGRCMGLWCFQEWVNKWAKNVECVCLWLEVLEENRWGEGSF